ncbi:UNVERIFIED_CONTAM: hypothetical protein GTU68_011550 [Idotea baltica]|nr:hypothetical protein [Idotea baltica]
MSDYSYVFNAHPSFIESIYKQYLESPDLVDEGWRVFFQGFQFSEQSGVQRNSAGGDTSLSDADLAKEFGVTSIIHGFRTRGHLLSKTNPIRDRRDRRPHLDLADYNLEESDLDKVFDSGIELGLKNATLRQILERLRVIYSGPIGFEYSHIEEREKRMWLREQIENRAMSSGYGLSIDKKKRILEKLNGAVIFERFLHTKYIGQKRFSLEGGESTIAAIDAIINTASEHGVEEVVMGMAHRGRLNVLANILGKTYEHIFNEFEGTAVPDLSFGDGDVKYHMGYSSMVPSANGRMINLKLAPNPSHLESVDPVVEGFARAKADILYNQDYDKILPILIHGDAAVVGQGVVYETAQMSKLDGYHTGGTIHFVINNQIGFTTDFEDARSSTYCTAAANMIQAPVFHVNGDHPEAVVFVAELAMAYRQKFNSDVFIDMVCYRKHGHNEGDDPKFTQPEMYKFISSHKDPREIYIKQLIERGDVEGKIATDLEKTFWNDLQDRLDLVKEKPLPYVYQEPELAWRDLKKKTEDADFAHREQIVDHVMQYPKEFTPIGKINRLLKGKRALLADKKMDWALGEWLAFGSLLIEGHDIRMSGQDVKRGTFSHRHAIFNDAKTFEEYNRFNSIQKDQGKFRIFNSLLSEFAVLGFEYGYSLATPNSLVIWEAQFGDFYNGAQTILDQYITAAESKWRRMSGLVMLLPHGYEGQGPEHSSARMERFLQSCAENNMTVANISTPANLFHAMRRQLYRPFRKPLVVMSPKSLLRHPKCVSSFEDFTGDTKFVEVIGDDTVKSTAVKRVILCTGKIFYDLDAYRRETHKIKNTAIIRLEQLLSLSEKTNRCHIGVIVRPKYNLKIWVHGIIWHHA